jgi:hypothetical protein
VYRLCNIRHLPRLSIATAADRRRHGRDACGKSAATFKYVTLVIPEIILGTAGLGLTWTDRAPNLYLPLFLLPRTYPLRFSVHGSPAFVVGSVQRRDRNDNQRSSRSVFTRPKPAPHPHTFNPALRIRPSNNHDLATIPPRFQRTIVHPVSATSVSVDPLSANSAQNTTPSTAQTVASKKQQFTFDQVHGPSTTQHAIFTSTANPLISRFLEGFNCTILAYGQTSSGKTHTMTGIDLDADPTDPENGMGIVPRAVATIFREQGNSARNELVLGTLVSRAPSSRFTTKTSLTCLPTNTLPVVAVRFRSGR